MANKTFGSNAAANANQRVASGEQREATGFSLPVESAPAEQYYEAPAAEWQGGEEYADWAPGGGEIAYEEPVAPVQEQVQQEYQKPAAAEPSSAQAATAGLASLNANIAQEAQPTAQPTQMSVQNSVQEFVQPTSALAPNVQQREESATMGTEGVSPQTLSAPVQAGYSAAPAEQQQMDRGQSETERSTHFTNAMDNSGNQSFTDQEKADALRSKAVETAPRSFVEAEPIDFSPVKRNRKFKGMADRAKEEVKQDVARQSNLPTGNSVVAKLASASSAEVGIREVSIGSNILWDAINQDGNVFLSRVNRLMGTDYSVELMDEDVFSDLIDTVNKGQIFVTLTKSPSTSIMAYQKRILKVHYGDGILIHPLAAKSFTADFDGDGGNLHLDGAKLAEARDAMAYLIGIDGSMQLDLDYLPLYKPVDNKACRRLFEMHFAGIVPDTRELADEYMKAIDSGNMEKFITKAYGMAGTDSNMAQLIDTMYGTFNAIDRAAVKVSEPSAFSAPEAMVEGLQLNPTDAFIAGIYEEARKGKIPPNFNQFVRDMNRFVGDVANANPDFRETASMAKESKRTSDMYVGTSNVNELYVNTAQHAMSLAMASRAMSGDKSLHVASRTKVHVITEVGYPGESLEQWLPEFAKAYNKWKLVELEAKGETDVYGKLTGARQGKLITIEKNAQFHTFAPFVEPFIEIYGDKTIGELFGNKIRYDAMPEGSKYDMWNDGNNVWWLAYKYKHIPLREFAYTNKAKFNNEPRKARVTDRATGQQWYDLLAAVADSKTGAASQYEQKVVKPACEAMTELAKMINSPMYRSNHEFNIDFIERKYMDTLTKINPDMFAFYNMDSAENFADSFYGKLFLDPKSDKAGTMLSMTVEWRLGRVADLEAALAEDGISSERYDALKTRLLNEWSVLASSSDAWKAIARVANIKKYAEAWNKMGYSGDIISYLLNVNNSYGDKCQAIADAVKATGIWDHTQPYEIMWQLGRNAASNYAGLNHVGWEETKSEPMKAALPSLQDMLPDWDQENRIAKVKSRPKRELSFEERIQSNIETDTIYSNITSLEGLTGHVQNSFIVDSILASVDKTTADSEKASTQASQAALYKALAEQRNGRVLNDVYFMNDQVMNIQSISDLTRFDAIRWLNGTDLRFYDEEGNLCVLPGSENPGADLQKYPELKAAFYVSAAKRIPGPNGDVSWERKDYVRENPKVQKLYDHPGYSALVSLLTPQRSKNDLSLRRDFEMTMDNLNHVLQTGFNPNDPIFDQINSIDQKRDLTAGTLAKSLMLKYMQELGAEPNYDAAPLKFQFDDASVAGFWATRQQLNAAKTSTSTGAEGAMTNNHEFLQLFFKYLNDEYIEVDADTDPALQEQLTGARTVNGTPYTPGMETIVYAPDFAQDSDPTLTDGPKLNSVARRFMIVRDKSGEDFNTKLQKKGDDGTDSIVKHSKIEMGAKLWPEYEDSMRNEWSDLLSSGMNPDDAIEVIRFSMAKILEANDARYGYKYETLADLMNTAKLMVVHKDGELFFRSLPQISNALNAKIPSMLPALTEKMPVEDMERIVNENMVDMTNVVNNVGLAAPITVSPSVLSRVRKPSKATEDTKVPGRKRSNSVDRNYMLLEQLVEDSGKTPLSMAEKDAIEAEIRKHVKIPLAELGDRKVIAVISDTFNSVKNSQPGPSNVLYCDSTDEKKVAYAIRHCFENKMVLMTKPENLKYLPEEYAGSAYANKWTIMVDFFDMELNGYGETWSSTFCADPSSIVWHLEDAHNRHNYADAAAIPTENFLNNRISKGTPGEFEDTVAAMFMNTLQSYGGWKHQFSIAGPKDLERLRTNPEELIDMRIQQANVNYDWYKRKYDKLFARFFDKWDGSSRFLSEAGQDEIVGFARCQLQNPQTGEKYYVFAPIIPYFEGGKAKRLGPDVMRIGDIKYDPSTGKITGSYVVDTDMNGRTVKVHEGLNRANKMIMFGEPVRDYDLRNGLKLDMLNSKATTASRRLGSNARLGTISSMMFMTYCDNRFRYNFADSHGALPGNPELREKIRTRRLSDLEWEELSYGLDTKWHSDPRINAFVRHTMQLCKKRHINPSDFLANKYNVVLDQGPLQEGEAFDTYPSFANMFYEFDMIMNTSMSWQNEMMHFMHELNPTLVADGFFGDDSNCLFKTCRDDGDAYGCLQLEVPFYGEDGSLKGYTLENVYGAFSFFGEDNSAFKRAGLNAAQIELQSMQQAVHGDNATTQDVYNYLRHAVAGYSPQVVKNTDIPHVEIDSSLL